ncbi:MAG TPA: CocE/NonD family hydrolase, partial [Bacteroidia bacterium]|nr:CocE/NonD family hydrolase [Bacteroidia bacterium]
MKHLSTLLIAALFPILLSSQILVPQVDSISLRDGEKIPADVYLPAGWTSGPVILIQTPYNRLWYHFGLPLGIGTDIDSSEYAIVIVDWRGFYGGAGAAYVGAPSRGEDGYDVVEWIATQTWSNDTIGTWGPSALGKVQYQTAKENPPHLVCICPVVAAPQFEYQEYFPNGCYRTEFVEQLDGLGYGM